ncbi:hypothetical protein Glove_14g26 [Diversispora epigaea]|uniref:Uncharacterized protein n=1 Tax=Diversispora epigaea TaxID=1348612 RepID=A0A397JM73_9GLOM|nr:hypothetical protein Glove_14g26 [Diversispora epigaea]
MRGLLMLSTREFSSQKNSNNKLDSLNTPITPTTPSPTTASPTTASKMFRFFFWNSPKIEKYSVENIKRLSELLLDYSKRGNDAAMIESLRELTQVLVWGDQNKRDLLDYFFERYVHHVFLNILEETTSPHVTKQLLQTMNILFENIHELTSLYFFLSNNYVNKIICHKFDFSNDEILAYFISLLRTLSFKLAKSTLCFFFNEHIDDFPLYSEAVKFFNSDESMVRVAARTITLNIFAVNDEQLQNFILDKKAAPFFSNLVYFISNHASILNDISVSPKYYEKYSLFNYHMAEHCDNFYYLNDIINIRMEKMNQVLTAHLMDLLIQPIYADSLVKKNFLPSKQRVRIDSVIALALLCHVLHIFRHTPLVTSMVVMLFSNSTSMMDYSSSPPTRFEYSNSWFKRNLYREAIMGFLKPEKSKNQYYYDLNTLPALCLLYMSCRNNAITPDVLIATDVYPQKLFKKRRLMDSLTSDYSDDDSFSFYTSSSMASTATSTSQIRPLFSDIHNNNNNNKSVNGLFIDEDVDRYGRRESGGSSSIPIPTIKISIENNTNSYGSQHTRNYRGELVQMILTLLCEYYPYCRPITLQMATEVLLELLHSNGSGDCLTAEQIEMMIKTEKILQDRIKKYKEFPLEECEKVISDSILAGDKYVGEIIMSAKLLFPPPPQIDGIDTEQVDIIKYVKALYLIRKSRTLLSRKTPDSPDSPNSPDSIDIPDIIHDVDTDIEQELFYQKCNDNDQKPKKPMKSMKSMFEEVKKFERQQQQMQDKKNIQSLPPDDEINDIEKRKKIVLDALGMQ